MRNRTLLLFVAAVGLGLLAAGCSQSDARSRRGGPGQTVAVAMQNIRFNPGELKVATGTTVVFTNKDGIQHDVQNLKVDQVGKVEAPFHSKLLRPNESWQITFNKPGVYPILCGINGHYQAGMIGTITVTGPDLGENVFEMAMDAGH